MADNEKLAVEQKASYTVFCRNKMCYFATEMFSCIFQYKMASYRTNNIQTHQAIQRGEVSVEMLQSVHGPENTDTQESGNAEQPEQINKKRCTGIMDITTFNSATNEHTPAAHF
jgi:homogentisate 1,2-dioxygenase